jgi:hypothetical protein
MGRGRRWAFEWLTQWTVKLDTDFEAVEAEEAGVSSSKSISFFNFL